MFYKDKDNKRCHRNFQFSFTHKLSIQNSGISKIILNSTNICMDTVVNRTCHSTRHVHVHVTLHVMYMYMSLYKSCTCTCHSTRNVHVHVTLHVMYMYMSLYIVFG